MPRRLALADNEPERVRRVKKLLLLAVAALLLTGCRAAPAETAQILFINVGKGDAILATAGDKHYLVDAGPLSAWGRVETALRHHGVTKLEGVFLTHSDKDHAGGLMPLAKSDVEISTWYASALYSLDDGKAHFAAEAAAVRGQQVVYLSAGDSAGPFAVLGPVAPAKDEDDNSLVLMLESFRGRALLTGDMKLDGEEALLRSGRSLQCDVLKLGHHGNSDATSDLLIERANPRLAVVSTDSGERPELPDQRVVKLLESREIPLFTTWKSGGGVLVTLDGENTRAELVSWDSAA